LNLECVQLRAGKEEENEEEEGLGDVCVCVWHHLKICSLISQE